MKFRAGTGALKTSFTIKWQNYWAGLAVGSQGWAKETMW